MIMASNSVEVWFKWILTYKIQVRLLAWYASLFNKQPVDVKILSFQFYPKYYPFLSRYLGVKKNIIFVYGIKVCFK